MTIDLDFTRAPEFFGHRIEYHVQNLGPDTALAGSIAAELILHGPGGEINETKTHEYDVPAGGTYGAAWTLPLSGLPDGDYLLRVNLFGEFGADHHGGPQRVDLEFTLVGGHMYDKKYRPHFDLEFAKWPEFFGHRVEYHGRNRGPDTAAAGTIQDRIILRAADGDMFVTRTNDYDVPADGTYGAAWELPTSDLPDGHYTLRVELYLHPDGDQHRGQQHDDLQFQVVGGNVFLKGS